MSDRFRRVPGTMTKEKDIMQRKSLPEMWSSAKASGRTEINRQEQLRLFQSRLRRLHRYRQNPDILTVWTNWQSMICRFDGVLLWLGKE